MGFLRQLIERPHLRRFITNILICCMLFDLPASVVLAGPEGAEVIHGQVSLQQSGLNTVIHASDKSIINYTSFDIARPEVVQFIQPGSNASVLNRILSANPTFIDGTLLANGRVFFVNPAGVIIGSGAKINVSQLVASGLNISNDSFINGQYEFVGGGGSVTNYGDISAKSVYLVGKQVTNIGNINCPAGYVVMAAGDRVFLGQPGSSVIVEIGSLEPPEQVDAQTPAEIINEGTVEAAGGKIILAAAGDAFSRPIMTNIGSLSTSNANGDAGDISLQAGEGFIDNTGIITATSNSDVVGTITAVAGEVINTGTIDVSGTQGGTVTIEATARLGQFGTVNADGIDGDGGSISLTAGDVVALGSESVTTANAGINGDGGDVIVYSPDTALFRNGALIEAKGGNVSGDGGFVEVSGREHVEVFGSVIASAANGKPGQFLIDPRNITINDNDKVDGGLTGPAGEWEPSSDDSELDIDSLEEYLDTQSVTITTSGDGSQNGWVHFNAGRDLYDGTDHDTGSGFSLTVYADDYILLDSGIHFNGNGNVTLDADRGITTNAEIFLNSGLFTANAGNSIRSGILSINQDITAGSMILTAGNQSGYDFSNSRVYIGYTPVSDEINNAGEGTFDTTVDLVSTNPTTGDITIKAVHDVFIGGKVLATGDISIVGDVEGSTGHPEYGGDIITKSDITAGGSIEFKGNAIDIDDNVRANGGNLVITGRSSRDISANGIPHGTVLDENAEWGYIDVAANKTLFAGGDISIIDYQNGGADSEAGQMALAGHDSLTVDASGGEIDATDVVIGVLGSSLALKQAEDLDLANFTFNNQSNTDLMAQSYNGSFTADNTNTANAADQWQSITATAEDNIMLSGSGNINIASAGLSSASGGVKIVSTAGTISTPGAGGMLDAPITGSSNGTTGVDLPAGGKAAIVIISKDTLKLGPGAEMAANGTYGSVDDRPGIDFLNVIEGDKNPGNPVDVAVYLASNTGNINLNSPVTIAPDGAMVVDAYDTVEPFGIEFLNSLSAIDWLEVCSRITPTLKYAQDNDTLPYASDPGLFPGDGTYVLRGEYPDVGTGAWVLEEEPIIPERTPIEAEVTSTVVPVTPDISDVGPFEDTTISNNLQWLGEELGLCEGDQQDEDENQCQEITQAYLAGAFLQTSDLRPHQAAAQLRELAELLHDTDETRIAALGRVVNEFVQPNVPPSPEQFASIGQAFSLHVNDGTHYATAKQWLDALGEYTMLLISEIGWTSDYSVEFVMGKYGPTVTEGGNISVIAFIQMHLEGFVG